MFRIPLKITVAAAAVMGIFFQANTAFSATPLSALEITTDHEVVYCSTGPIPVTGKLRQALAEGTPVTFSWEIVVDKVRSYWLNDTIASVTFVRQAVPDLISKSWLLTDTSSGISQRVYSADEAILFLSRLDHFPVLDQSLLSSGTNYELRIKLYMHEGELSTSWWSELIHFSKTVAQKIFTLP